MASTEHIDQIFEIANQVPTNSWSKAMLTKEFANDWSCCLVVCQKKEQEERNKELKSCVLKQEKALVRSRCSLVEGEGLKEMASVEEVIGFCLLWSAPDESHVLNLVVSSERRRRGIARMLMECAAQVARKDKAMQMILEVRASNQPALCLYRSLGFVQIGTRKRYYKNPKEDAFVFSLALGDVS